MVEEKGRRRDCEHVCSVDVNIRVVCGTPWSAMMQQYASVMFCYFPVVQMMKSRILLTEIAEQTMTHAVSSEPVVGALCVVEIVNNMFINS